jgi:DNA-nicking Smr family endonuclease
MKARSLGELAALKKALQGARRQAAEAEARERERLAHEAAERNLFALSVGAVQPLRKAAHGAAPRARPHAVPRQRIRDEAAVLVESISDEFDVESLLETDEALSFRRPDIGPEVVRKLRRGVWATQAQLDLHGLRRDEAREQLGAFLRDATRGGLRCVRVIHGKGNGSPGREPVLKTKVKGWLVQKEEVIAFVQARASDGGNGALMVLLRSTPSRAEATSHPRGWPHRQPR